MAHDLHGGSRGQSGVGIILSRSEGGRGEPSVKLFRGCMDETGEMLDHTEVLRQGARKRWAQFCGKAVMSVKRYGAMTVWT